MSDLKSRLRELEDSVSTLEKKVFGETGKPKRPSAEKAAAVSMCAFCSVPHVPARSFKSGLVSTNREQLIRSLEDKWLPGSKITYGFFDDHRDQQQVKQAFQAWRDTGMGLMFEQVPVNQAMVRIAFSRVDGMSWSYVGRYCLKIPAKDPTMNFGWSLQKDLDTALHEVGHCLGYNHEHQNANAGIAWNEDVVYRDLGGPPNHWDRDTVYWNVIHKIEEDAIDGSSWDPDSIMHYPIPPRWIASPEAYRNGLTPRPGLSEIDISTSLALYPPPKASVATLEELKSQVISVAAGGTAEFRFLPSEDGKYIFRTCGRADVVMVLFDSQNRFVVGDDDSGDERNAMFSVPLKAGTDYYLRLRLYWSDEESEFAVICWRTES